MSPPEKFDFIFYIICNVLCVGRFSCIRLFATLCAIACQFPLCLGFSRQEYWTGLPCPPPGDLTNLRIEPMSLKSPTLAGMFFTTSTAWEAHYMHYVHIYELLLFSC